MANNLTEQIRQRIAKVRELTQKGATDGEKAAAQAALDRLAKAYNLSEVALANIELVPRFFSYKWDLEKNLFSRILVHIVAITQRPRLTNYQPAYPGSRGFVKCRCLTLPMTYADFVVASCAYEYFRRHMKAQWDKEMKAELARCRTPKTRAAKRKWFEPYFLSKYILASGLYHEDEVVKKEYKGKAAESAARFRNVEGGQYKTQVERSGYLLES